MPLSHGLKMRNLELHPSLLGDIDRLLDSVDKFSGFTADVRGIHSFVFFDHLGQAHYLVLRSAFCVRINKTRGEADSPVLHRILEHFLHHVYFGRSEIADLVLDDSPA